MLFLKKHNLVLNIALSLYWEITIDYFIHSALFLTTGAITIPGSGGGMIFGGYMVKKFNLRVRGIIFFCCACIGIAALFGPSFLASCPSQPVAGVSTSYNM